MPQPTKKEIALQRRHDRLMTLIETPYIRALIRAKNKYITAVSKAYEIDGTLPEALTLEHRQDMFAVQSKYDSRTITVFAKDVHNEFKKNILLFLEKKQEDDEFDRWLRFVIAEWISNETALAASVTALTTRDDIRNAIAISVAEGETSAQTAKKILKVKGLSPFRSETIALTETHNAAMYANKQSGLRLERESGESLTKVWIPVQDSRTREAHAAMNGHQAINMDSLFTVGGDRMDRPGDPRGSAGNVIRCRCTLAYRVAE